MSRKSDWLERATAHALDSARAKAKAEGREPTAEEFAAAISGVGEPPKRQRRARREPVDPRWDDFTMWIWTLSGRHHLEDIEQAPGGFDPLFFAEKLKADQYHLKMCQKALAELQRAIPLIEAVLAQVDGQPIPGHSQPTSAAAGNSSPTAATK
jgi:hypothetical protein